jgi:uncharacterized protein
MMSNAPNNRHPVLERLGLPEFRPLPPFFDGRLQTVAIAFWPQPTPLPPTATETINLPDGDQLVLLENRPLSWQPGDRIVVLVHGLAGCHESQYMVRLARKLNARGYLAYRVNLRGCGPGFGLARRPYHSGRSEDLRAVQIWLAARHPGSPVTQVGFSLGANITLKMVGEDAASPSGNLDSAIAVSPPMHLAASAKKLQHSKNRIFTRHFLDKLLRQVARARVRYPDIPELRPFKGMHLTDFDDLFTAPQSGFASAAEYYEKAASLPLISSIRVPTLILTAADDPVVDTDSVRGLPAHPGVDVVITARGGHVGFLSRDLTGTGLHWMDAVILRWIEERGTV